MMLLPSWKREVGVGGERMDMSRAVPRRRGTSGVSSRATMGRTLGLLVGLEVVMEECLAKVGRSKASIRPGLTRMMQSFG